MQQQLIDIGAWLEVNGESIFDTRKRGATKQTAGEQELYFTTKADDLFCIFTKWTPTMTMEEIPCLYAWTLQFELK